MTWFSKETFTSKSFSAGVLMIISGIFTWFQGDPDAGRLMIMTGITTIVLRDAVSKK